MSVTYTIITELDEVKKKKKKNLLKCQILILLDKDNVGKLISNNF